METLIRHLCYKVQSIESELEFFECFERPEIFHEFKNEKSQTYGVLFKLTNGLDIELFITSAATNYNDVHFAFAVEDLDGVWNSLSCDYRASNIFTGKTDFVRQFHVRSPSGFGFEFHHIKNE